MSLLFISLVLYLLSGCSDNSSPLLENQQGELASQAAMPVSNFTGELLAGKVIDSSGNGVGGVPIRAHKQGSNITAVVYTNANGDYSFPEWADISPGEYSVAIKLAEFEPVNRTDVVLTEGETLTLDMSLQSRTPSVMDATATDIVMALPGTDEEKFLFIQCDNCHSLQWALRQPRPRDEWEAIVKRMFGVRRSQSDTPGTMANGQQKNIEPLVNYLAKIRGPETAGQEIPFDLQPRPTDDASTNIVVTEYDIPRQGEHDPYLLRADNKYAWPHDIIVDEKYGYYTDHFTHMMGRLDKQTGEVKEFFFDLPPGTGRPKQFVAREGEVGYPGRPGGGPHDILFDSQGRPVMGMRNVTVRFNPETETFTTWQPGGGMFGLDPMDNVWVVEDEGNLYRLNMPTGEVTEFKIPAVDGIYDIEADSQGQALIDVWGNGFFRLFDPETETFKDIPTLTPGSGPRRGDMTSDDKHWVALYWAGRLAMFDARTGEVAEYPLVPGSEPFGPPFVSPYSAAVDEKNQLVWTTDFNASKIYLFDIKTETMTPFFMPEPYEVRDVTVDKHAERPTLWIPAYRAPSKMVKVQLRGR